MDRAIQIRFLCGEMYRQCKEYLSQQEYPALNEKATQLKEEMIRLYADISSLVEIRNDLS